MKNISKRLLSFMLVVMMILSMMPNTVFAADVADLTIGTVDDLRAFADAVNKGNSYEGKLVVLANDINLGYTAVVIGTKANPFKGTFDGQNHTVSNLTIYEDGSESDYFADTDDCLGLFGVLNTPGVIKNVTVDNPYIVGGSYVGGIVGMGYTGKIENCHVTGEIDIEGYYMVGGITGHGYARIHDCSVIGQEGWDYNYIGASYKEANLEGDNVGGIVGHNAENNVISDCTVKNVTVSGTRKVGGIVGITAQSTDISGCKVENVTVETTATAEYAADNTKTMSIGGIVGQYMANANGVGGTLTDCTVNGLAFANKNNVDVNAGALTGGVRASSGTTFEPAEGNITLSGNTAANVEGETVTYLEPAAPSYAVQIGEQGYESLADALIAAATMTGNVTVEIYDKVTLSSALSGSFDSIKFVGKDTDAEVYLEVQGYITATGKKVAFEDLKLSKSVGGYITNAGFMNVAFGVYDVAEVTYTGCTFANGAYASSGKVTYTDCTFYRSHDKYGLWAYGNVNVTVDNCTFADYRGIKMYAEGAAKTVDLTVKNTDFSAVNNKPAIVLTYGQSVTLDNNTYSSTGVFELDLDGAPNGTAVTSDVAPTCKNDNGACGVLVDGKIYTTVAQAAAVATEGSVVTLLHDSAETVELEEGVILDKNGFTAAGITVKASGLTGSGTEADPYLINDLEDLIWFRDNVNTYTSDRSNQYVGKYVKMTADIDLAGINWTPIGTNSVGDHMAFMGTFDGDGHTIFNLHVNADGANLGFFAYTGSYNEAEKAVIKNLNFHNVDVSSNSTGSHAGSYVGGVIANCGGNTYVENVNLTGDVYVVGYGYVGGIVGHGYPKMTDSTVVAEDGSYVQAHYWCAGGATGYAGEGSTFTNITVSGLDVYGALGAAAAVVGLANDNDGQVCKLTNVHAENVEVTGGNYVSGYVAGNGNTAVMTDVTAANVTLGSGIAATDAVATIGNTAYFDLKAAMDAARDGDTVKLLADITYTKDNGYVNGTWVDGLVYTGDKSFTVDFGGHTITDNGDINDYLIYLKNQGEKDNEITFQNGKIIVKSDRTNTVWAAVTVGAASATHKTTLNLNGMEIVNNNPNNESNLVIRVRNGSVVNLNNGTVVTSDGASYGASAETGSTLNVNSGAQVVQTNSGTTSGNVVYTAISGNGTINIYDGAVIESDKYGIHNMTTGNAVINIYGGTITAPVTVHASTNGGTGETATVTITGGTFNGTLETTNNDSKIVVSGGRFSSDVTEYLADGVTLAKNPDGTFTAGKLPEAQIDDLGNVTITNGNPEENELTFEDSYYIYDLIGNGGLSTGTEPFDLQLAMKFTAKDDAAAAAQNAYGDYITDFHIQISGLKDGYIYGDGCYLAGYYKSFGAWVVIPLDGFKIENGMTYPMITAAGFNFSYEVICSDVKEFTCGIYMAPEILAANPDLKVSLALGLSETPEKALASEFVTVGEPLEYGVEKLHGVVDVDGVGYDSLTEALKDVKDGSVVTLLQDVKVTGKVIIDDAITLNGNGYSITADETATWTTGSGFNKKTTHLVHISASNVTLKNVVLDNNKVAGGVNVIGVQNVVFDNVSITNANKALAALTVNNSSVVTKTKFTATGCAMAVDIDKGTAGMTAEPGTVFALDNKVVNFKVSGNTDLSNAVKEDGTPYFAAMDNAYYYTQTQIDNRTTGYTNGLKLLDDVTLSKDVTIGGTLDLNGNDLNMAEGKALNVSSKLTVTGEGSINGAIRLTKATATVTAPENANVTTNVAGYKLVYDGQTHKLEQIVYVAYIGEQGYETVDEAVKAAKDGDTIRLDSADTAISMNATVDGNRTITFTGVALVDWTKGNLWIGRNGTGNGKVIFDGATITSAVKKMIADTGIHVSGAKAGSTGTCDGVLVIKNSTIELDYLINRNEVVISDNGDLTVYGGTYVHGRAKDESDSGTDEVATLTVKDSKLTIVNSNGEGIGGESYGELILEKAQVVCQSAFIVNANGTVKMDTNSTITATELTGEGSINIDATDLTADKVVITAATADFTGAVTVTGNDSAEKKVNADNIQIVIVENPDVAQNVQTGATYATVQEAVNAAAKGETVKLLADCTEEWLLVAPGVKLDLNGKTLTVTDSLVAAFNTAHIIDNTNGEGLLVLTGADSALNSYNEHLPMWTAEGVRFTSASFRQKLTKVDENTAQYAFYLNMDLKNSKLGEILENGSAGTGISIRIKVTYTTANGMTAVQYFELTSEMVAKYVENSATQAIALTVTGTQGRADLTFTAEIASQNPNDPKAPVVVIDKVDN